MPDGASGAAAFLSYAHVDRGFAIRLRDALGTAGKQAWLDETEIRGGTRWNDEMQRAIQTADAFVFLLTPDTAASRECAAELAHAVSLNKRILPLRGAETPMDGVPAGLADYQFIPGRGPFATDFDGSLCQLITEIDTDHD